MSLLVVLLLFVEAAICQALYKEKRIVDFV